jgi:hypothetical protein
MMPERGRWIAEEGRDSLREFSRLLGTAIVSFDALQAGRVGSGGTTAAVFRNCLVEMRFLLDDPKRVAAQAVSAA